MKLMKVCTVLGTRPEAIKLASVIKCLNSRPDVDQRLLVTGQHRQLLDPLLKLFEIQPARDFNIMCANQRLSDLTARVLTAVDEDLKSFRPEWTIVQGDTTTAMAAALAAYHLRIGVAHVEAGLRTYDRHNPFPEEINRRLIDSLAVLHFAPTDRARQNLIREGFEPANIFVTGNTGIDALLEIAGRDPSLIGCPSPSTAGERMLLVTAHRRESFGEDLNNICRALSALIHRNADIHISYVVHPNPNVSGPVHKQLEGIPRLELLPAMDYEHFVRLMKASFLILTDSGGIQEEAPSLGKPVLVLRARTERQEAIEAGTAKLVGTNPDTIVKETERLLRDSTLYAEMAQTRNPYGDGHAAERIVSILAGRSWSATPENM